MAKKTKRPFEGVWLKGTKYVLSFRYQRKPRNFSGYTDARLTSRLREDILRALERHDAGEAVKTKGLSKRAVEILSGLGVVKAKRQGEIPALIEEYRGVLQARNCCADHIKAACTRIGLIVEGCEFSKPSDIEAGPVEGYLHGIRTRKQKPVGISTSNHYREALVAFTNWLIDEGLLDSNPLRKLKKLNARVDVRRKRRPISDEHFDRLIAATLTRKTKRQLSNQDRALVYIVSRASGLRAAEVASLTPLNFRLDDSPPVVVVRAVTSKHRREDRQVLPAAMVEELRPLMDRPSKKRLWPGQWYRRAAEMLAEDLEAAGLEVMDDEGRQLDFHALRHTYISGLARAGVHPKIAQKLARHSTIQLTMETYTHIEEEQLSEALEQASMPGSMLQRMPSGHTGEHDGARGRTEKGKGKKASGAKPNGRKRR